MANKPKAIPLALPWWLTTGSAQFPATGFVRLRQIIGDPKANPPIPPIIPVGKSTWWAGVASGRYPPALKLGPKITVWRASDILALIEEPKRAA